MVTFTSRAALSPEEELTEYRRLGGPKSGRCGQQNNLLLLLGMHNSSVVQPYVQIDKNIILSDDGP
jgi:hypothetical protein